MSDLSFMSDVSMTQLRVLSLVGLLGTAVITVLLTMLLTTAGAALGRLARHALDRYRGAANGAAASGTVRPPGGGPRSKARLPFVS